MTHFSTKFCVSFYIGNYVNDDVVGSLIQLLSACEDNNLYTFAVRRLWKEMSGIEPASEVSAYQPLCQVGTMFKYFHLFQDFFSFIECCLYTSTRN